MRAEGAVKEGEAKEGLSVRVLHGAAWQMLATSTQAVLQLAVIAVLARHVTAVEFGMITAAQVFIGILQLVGEAGIAAAVVQRAELTDRHLRAGYFLGALSSIALVALFWGASPAFSSFFHAAPLVPLLRALSLSVVFSGLGLVSRARLERALQFGKIFWLDTASYVVGYVLVGITGALLGWGAWALCAAILVRYALFTVAVSVVVPPDYRLGFGRTEVKDLFGFGGAFTVARILDYFAWQADYMVAGRWLGLAPLGTYQRAFELMELPGRYLGKIAEKVLFASMAQIQEQRERLAAAFTRSVEIAAVLVFPMSVLMLILAPEIVRVLYGPKWLDTVPPLQVLLVTPLFRTTGRVAESLSRAVGAVYSNAWRKAVSAATVFSGAFIGHYWGIVGVACGAAAAITFNSLLLAHLALRATRLGWLDLLAALRPALVTAALAGLSAYPVAFLTRGAGAPAIVVLAASGAAAVAAFAGAAYLRPSLYGSAGGWLVERAARAAGPALGRFVPRAVRPVQP